MPYNSLATVNPGDVLSSSAWGNQAKANEDYLFSGRPGQTIKRDNNASYTTTSNTFVSVDGTNLVITATIASGKALVGFVGTIYSGATSTFGEFDVDVDGTRIGGGGVDGITAAAAAATNATGNVSFVALVTGLSVGAHTFTLKWRTPSGNTINLAAGDGTGGQDSIPMFWVEEIG